MKVTFKRITTYLILAIAVSSCVEEIDLETETVFEDVLVIEATITNEIKRQEIKLTRTIPLEEEGSNIEHGANVKVIGSNGMIYQFEEDGNGMYLSSMPFAAESDVDYQLEIQTNDGNSYGSSDMQLTQETQIDDLYLELGFNENDEEGISLFIDSFDPSGNSKFYRYTYEETYKVIAPFWSPEDLIVVEYNFPMCPVFAIQPKVEEQLTCYNTVKSTEVILENTNLFEEDRVDKFRVRFLNRDNYIISHRYSIMVRQYTQSNEAHIYYKTLRDLSSSESLLSQSQPGFIEGNVFSMTDSSEKVLGFFEVSSVDSRRIYFNYEDLYPGELIPPFIISCIPFSPSECNTGGTSPLADALSESQGAKYYSLNENPEEMQGSYFIVPAPCGNCTVLGDNVVPDFWIE